MNKRALRVLEFNKIKEKITKYAATGATREMIMAMEPYETVYEIKKRLDEVEEALDLLMKK